MSAVVRDEAEVAVLPQACTPCMARLDARPWYTTLAVRTGDFHSGVRVNTPAAAELIGALVAAQRAPEMDQEVAANFSVEVHRGSHGGSRALHLVYRDHEVVSRRREIEDLMTDLVELLDEPARLASNAELAVHTTGVLTPERRVVLLPGAHHRGLLTRRPQLERSGLELLRTRTQSVDATTSEVVLDLHDAALAQMFPHGVDGRQLGRRRLQAWCLPGPDGPPRELSPAEGIFAAYSTVLNRSVVGNGPALQALARAAATTVFWAMPHLSPAALASWLTDTFGIPRR